MEHVLIVSGSSGAGASLSEFVRESLRCNPKVVYSAYQTKTALEKDPFLELAIINAPLADESGVELAEFITQETASHCILLLRQEKAEELADHANRHQILVMNKPLNKTSLYQLLITVNVAVQRSQTLFAENQRLERKIKDIRTVDRAKFMLMQYQGMTEEQAHSYLEHYAMDKRKRKPIAALEIIDRINEQYL